MIIAAPPGYWWLRLDHGVDDSGRWAEPLEFVEGPVIAWQVTDKGAVLQPIAYIDIDARNPNGRIWDTALEVPDGRCIDDAGLVWVDRATWLEQSRADFAGCVAEERAA
jgi:hypothetical protein